MFKFIKQDATALLSLTGTPATKCISLKNEPSLAIPSLIDLNPNELRYHPLMVSWDRCN